MKQFWDFDERINYVTEISPYNGKSYKVINRPGKNKAVKLLSQIDNYITKISLTLMKNYNNYPDYMKDPIFIFLSIHPSNHKLMEMQLNTEFMGLNKPKNVKINKKLPPLGKDGYLKAGKRYIFFQLRKSNGKFKTFAELRPLVLHEITHTMANHVTWRDDDHGTDFKRYYYFLSKL